MAPELRRRPGALGLWLMATLLRFVPREQAETILGDLIERYADKVDSEGPVRARLWWWGQLLRLRPIALRREFGRTRVESVSSMRGAPSGGDLPRDILRAVRSNKRRASFATTVLGSIAITVGVTTATFSVVHGVLLKPLPFPDSDRLVQAWQTMPEWDNHENPTLRYFASRFPLSVPTFLDWQSAYTGLESLGIYTSTRWVLASSGGAEFVTGELVTSGVFEALDVEPIIGRRIQPEDDLLGAPPVVVLSYEEWQQRFAGDPSIPGRTLSLDTVPHTVIGVMPPGFAIPAYDPGLWVSLPDSEKLDERDHQSYTVLGRMAPGESIAGVQAALDEIQARLLRLYPEEQGEGAAVESVLDSVVGNVRSTLFLLLASVGLVLAIACVNIANMFLLSGVTRSREFAVRSALGADGRRLAREVLVETGVLVGLGGLAGIAFAALLLPVLTSVLPSSLPRIESVSLDLRVVAFGIGLTAITAAAVGILPAWYAGRVDPAHQMAGGRGSRTGPRGTRLRFALAVGEVALAFTLLVGSGLVASSFLRLWHVDRGFEPAGLVEFVVEPDPGAFPGPEERSGFRADLARALDAISGTEVTHANQVPLGGGNSATTYHFEDADGELQPITVTISVVDPSYFRVMGIGVVRGRAFDDAGPTTPLVAVVNESLAAAITPADGSPLDRELRADPERPPVRVVGVARDVRHARLDQPPSPKLYVPAVQNHREPNHWVLRTQQDPAEAMAQARAAVASVSTTSPIRDVRILDRAIARSVAVPRFRALFLIGLALIASVLALLGVYGVVAFTISHRRRELALRIAIGARPDSLRVRAIGTGARITAIGAVLGLLVTWSFTPLIEGFLFEISRGDPRVYLTALLVSVGVGVAASYGPARQASTLDPMEVLQEE